MNETRHARVFCFWGWCIWEMELHLPLHQSQKKKACYLLNSKLSFTSLVGRDRLELSTKGL